MPSMALELVVVAIVLLVAALVILTMFGGGMTQLGQITNAQNNCKETYRLTCLTTGGPPSTWTSAYVYTDAEGKKQTCSTIVSCDCKSDGKGNYIPSCY